MRLIDADALKEQVLDWISEQVASKYISHDACMATRKGARVAFNLLNDAPTISAAPVVRGEWEIAIGYDPKKKVQCQSCYKMAYEPTAYCPNCGAKMGGKQCK